MKIAFITGSLVPGRDGVGDYARRLAAELIRLGHPTAILGLNESKIQKAAVESQEIEGISVPALRLPNVMSWEERTTIARKWLDEFNPDWVSLQFVPFAFHPKGLPFGLPCRLKAIIGSRPLHWMFHELWVLWSFPLPFRQRVLGQVQKLCLRWCLKNLKPEVCATQLPLYQLELKKIGVTAVVIPLHGNIPVCHNPGAEKWLADRCSLVTDVKRVKVGFFGNILPTLDSFSFAERVTKLKVRGDELVVLSAGKIGRGSIKLWYSMEQKLAASATFIRLGEINDCEASLYLSALDYGLTSYPPELMGKSGSVAAMREHGLPVFACGSMARHSSGQPGEHGQNHEIESWTVKQTALALLNQL